MPGGDRTGPMGLGEMTGRGMGLCAGYDVPGLGDAAPRGRMYRGRGGMAMGRGGRGFRNRYYATGQPGWMRAGRGMQAWGYPAYTDNQYQMSPDNEMEQLKKEKEYLKKELDDIQERINSIEKDNKET